MCKVYYESLKESIEVSQSKGWRVLPSELEYDYVEDLKLWFFFPKNIDLAAAHSSNNRS